MKEVIIIRGCQGAGKSTLANMLVGLNRSGIIIEADNFMYEDGVYKFHPSKLNMCHEKAFNLFSMSIIDGVDLIIVSNVGAKWDHCSKYFDLAKSKGYKVTSIIVENRNDTKNLHDVDLTKVEQVAKSFEIKLV